MDSASCLWETPVDHFVRDFQRSFSACKERRSEPIYPYSLPKISEHTKPGRFNVCPLTLQSSEKAACAPYSLASSTSPLDDVVRLGPFAAKLKDTDFKKTRAVRVAVIYPVVSPVEEFER